MKKRSRDEYFEPAAPGRVDPGKVFVKAFYQARKPEAAALTFAFRQPGGPRAVQWIDKDAGLFRLMGQPETYKVETFTTGYAVFRIAQPNLPHCG